MRVCENPEILFRELKESCFLFELICSVTDEFTVNLINIAKKAIHSPYFQPIVLGVMRSDYMVEKDKEKGKSQMFQIELNTISCSYSINMSCHLTILILELFPNSWMSRYWILNDMLMIRTSTKLVRVPVMGYMRE